MKKAFKRMNAMICAIITTIILVIPSVAVDFTEYGVETEVDFSRAHEILLKKGYPQDYLETLPEIAQTALAEDTEYSFDSAIVSYYTKDGDLLGSYEISSDSVTPFAQIPDSDLTLVLTVGRSNKADKVCVTLSYLWSTLPGDYYEDALGIAWDDKYFWAEDNGFYKKDCYTARLLQLDGSLGDLKPYTHSEATHYADVNDHGVVWYADLYSPSIASNKRVEQYNGFGQIVLVPQKSNFTTRIFATYVHAKSSASFSFEIPVVGVNFEIPSKTAGMATQKTYTYNK